MPTSRLSVLVVEDNAADADLVRESLTPAPGVTVAVASDGRQALDRLRDGDRAGRVQIVLLDLNLPGRGGLETLADIKSDPALRRIPVVVLTTSKSSGDVERSYELGAAAVLNKPLRLRDYRSMVTAFRGFWLEHVRFPTESR